MKQYIDDTDDDMISDSDPSSDPDAGSDLDFDAEELDSSMVEALLIYGSL